MDRGTALLDLDDRRWAELTHAYGSAADIPPLLRQLREFPPATDYRAEPCPDVPVGLVVPYREALRRLPDVVRAMAGVAWDEGRCLVAASAMAVANGHTRLAEAILELEPTLLDAFLDWVRTR